MNHHFIVAEWIGCPNEPRSDDLGGFLPSVGTSKANWSLVRSQTKRDSKTLL